MSRLPKRANGRPSSRAIEVWDRQITEFCDTIKEIASRLDFSPGSRGWAYILEGWRGINKDEIDAAQALINDCRKSGQAILPHLPADAPLRYQERLVSARAELREEIARLLEEGAA
jgi:hypothetical protein